MHPVEPRVRSYCHGYSSVM